MDIANAISNAERERRNCLMYPDFDPSVSSPVNSPNNSPRPVSSKLTKNKLTFLDEGKSAPVIETDIMILERATGCKIAGTPLVNTEPNPATKESSTSLSNNTLSPRPSDTILTPKRMKLWNQNVSDDDQPLDLSSPKSRLMQLNSSASSFRGYKLPTPMSAARTAIGKECRKALQGPPAMKAYGMPPLPPTCSTINAFKHLLLQRRKLIHTSGKYNVPGSLSSKKKSLKLSNDSTSAEDSSTEVVSTSISSSPIIEISSNNQESVTEELAERQYMVPYNKNVVKTSVVPLNAEDIDPAHMPPSTKVRSQTVVAS